MEADLLTKHGSTTHFIDCGDGDEYASDTHGAIDAYIETELAFWS